MSHRAHRWWLIGILLAGLLAGPVLARATTVAATPDEATRDRYFLNVIGEKEPATDSAAAATALATGFKTDACNIAWGPGDLDTGRLTTIAERLRAEKGFAIGVASTVPFSHATPATFVSHNRERVNYAEIAHEILFATRPEVVIGGGHPDWNDGDTAYVGGDEDWAALRAGRTAYTHVVSRTEGVDGGVALLAAAAEVRLSAGDKLAGVFGGSRNESTTRQVLDSPGAPVVARGSIENPSLADVVRASLGVLDQDPDGFFALFEQGDIDWSNHENNFSNLIGGVWDLDAAVRAAERLIAEPGGMEWSDTLLIVTADHANSYMRLPMPLGLGDLPLQTRSESGWRYPDGEVTYRTINHTNELVTLAAHGQGASLLADSAGRWYPGTRIVDNTQIYQAMLRAARERGVRHLILFVGDGMQLEHEIAASRYLYGADLSLAWHDWGQGADSWAGYAATWDVTTYNLYASVAGKLLYASPSTPATLGQNDPSLGYDPERGGTAAYPIIVSPLQRMAVPLFPLQWSAFRVLWSSLAPSG